jgi:nucleoside-diphosphate-sugar epimerase
VRLLVLGGTRFLGRSLVEQALARGHELTLFNRGRTAPELFPEARRLVGDRDGGLDALADGEWDAVVDVACFVPRVVRASAELLAGRVAHYAYISSISAYADLSGPVSEDSPVGELDDPQAEGMEHYGPLKAASERVVREVYPGRSLVVRPGLIVGPHDPTGRFTYWAHRVRHGGEILAPGPPERHVQLVHVGDLASFVLDLVEREDTGLYNATHPGIAWRELLAGADATWVGDDFLVEQGVEEWMELPLWLSDPAFVGMLSADVSRALAAGLGFRPVDETLRDAAEAPLVEGVGLTPEREAELLAAWHGR